MDNNQLKKTTKTKNKLQTNITPNGSLIAPIKGENRMMLILIKCQIITEAKYLLILGNNPASLTNCIRLVLMVEIIVKIVRKNPIKVPLTVKLPSTIELIISSNSKIFDRK